MKLLKTTTHRSYVFIPKAGGADPRERNGALAHWAKIGKDMGVDLLIVPQILDWRERAGSSAGVTTSAAVNMDFYLIDVREPGGALVSRSHFKEKQVGLSDNLMNFDTFLKRGAKWLTAQELAMEGMQKMIKESKKTLDNEDEQGEYMQYFSDTLNQEYSKIITDNGGTGLAQQLYDSLKGTYNIK